eukprot:m.121668 g.121668  ORF g.121668 m.121668 type:complete len:74 (+) comp37757_c0_seq14:3435-3656(+)
MHRIQGSADSTDVENVINSRRRKRAVPLDLIKFVLYGKLACLPLNVRQTNSQRKFKTRRQTARVLLFVFFQSR